MFIITTYKKNKESREITFFAQRFIGQSPPKMEIDPSLIAELGNGKDIVIVGKGEKQEQKMNKHQMKKERKQLLLQKQVSKEKEKKLKRIEEKKIRKEKLQKVSELSEKIKENTLNDEQKKMIAPTTSIGKKLSDHEAYQEAIRRKGLGLPYDQKIIEKFDKKKEEAENKAQTITYEDYAIMNNEDKPVKPIPSAIQAVPLIKPNAKPTDISPVQDKVYTPKPSINVTLQRPEGIQDFRNQLPIIDKEQEIIEFINNDEDGEYGRDIIIICGETGSGKTTQVPQFIYEAGYGTIRTKGKIAITEPRRVAAINMSKRVAYEMGFRHGAEVGYHIRNNRLFSDSTIMKFLTDGVLLREIESDIILSQYSVIIIDEAHERTIHTDVLIGLLSKIVISRRKRYESGDKSIEPLKLVIMSATLRVEDFLNNPNLFEKPPPLINVEGRMYPVRMQFSSKTPNFEEMMDTVKNFVDQLHEKMSPGGILVFIPGKQEIHQLVDYFRRLPTKQQGNYPNQEMINSGNNNEEKPEEIEDFDEMMESENSPQVACRKPMHVLPMYSLLDPIEQEKVFRPPPEGSRLIVFTTNVAETSLTIPNIRYVVDTGLEKTRVFDFARGVIDAKVQWISQASAEQRMGRAGRTCPGYCFRLYSSGVYEHEFSKFSEPEILKRPVDEVVLLLKAMGLNDIKKFPFPTQITDEGLFNAETTLKHLGAIETEAPFKITNLGRALSSLPLSPRLARVIISSRAAGVLNYALIAVAALTVREPFESEPKPEFSSKYGDVIRLMNAFGAYDFEPNQKKISFCKENGLRTKAMEDIQSIRTQIGNVLAKCDILVKTTHLDPPSAEEEAKIAQSIFSGYCDQVAHKQGKGHTYITADKRKVELHGSSCLFETRPFYVTYLDCVNSEDKLRMNYATRIEPTWITMIGSPLLLVRGEPTEAMYIPEVDCVMARVSATFGNECWPLPPSMIPHPDPYKHFAAAFIEGKVCTQLSQYSKEVSQKLLDDLKNRTVPQRNQMIVIALKRAQISSRASLLTRWQKDPNFLLNEYLYWIESTIEQKEIESKWPKLSIKTK